MANVKQLVYKLHRFGNTVEPVTSDEIATRMGNTIEKDGKIYIQVNNGDNYVTNQRPKFQCPAYLQDDTYRPDYFDGADSRLGSNSYGILKSNFNPYVQFYRDENNPLVQLGIQCEQSECWALNSQRSDGKNGVEIVIGRNGIYELDNDIEIRSLFYKRRVKYIKNEAVSNEFMEVGNQILTKAREKAASYLNNITESMINSMAEDEKTSYYNNIQGFAEATELGYDYYLRGYTGIYEPELYAENNNVYLLCHDPQNIVIDYISKGATNNV